MFRTNKPRDKRSKVRAKPRHGRLLRSFESLESRIVLNGGPIFDVIDGANGSNVSLFDDSREVIVDVDNSGSITANDVIYGFVKINQTTPPPADPENQIYAIFSQTFDPSTFAAVSVGGGTVYSGEFLPTSPTSPYSLANLTGLPLNPSAMVALIDASGGFSQDLATAELTPNVMGSYISLLATEGTVRFTAGFGSGATNGDDFFAFQTQLLGIPGVPDPVADLSLVPTLSASISFGNFGAGLTVLDNFLPVTFNESVSSQFFQSTTGTFYNAIVDAAILNGNFGGTLLSLPGQPTVRIQSGFADFINNADFVVNATVNPTVDAKITIEPDATNEVGDLHTFTATVWADDGDGVDDDGEMGLFDRVGAGEDVTVTLTNLNGATAPGGPFVGVTDANGEFKVTFTSPTAGQVIGHAESNVNVGGQVLLRETEPVGVDLNPNGNDAVKTFVDAKIVIAPDDTNEVGDDHTFTATVYVDNGDGIDSDNDGSNFDPVGAGEDVTITLVDSNGAVSVPSTPLAGVTNANGQFSVTFSSLSAGLVTGSAKSDVDVDGLVLTRTTDGNETVVGSGENNGLPAVKRFVNAKIILSPLDATNLINDPHVITATVLQDDGLTAAQGGDGVTGFAPAPNGAVVEFALVNSEGATAVFVGGNSAIVSGGMASVTINSPTSGTVTINGTTSFSVGGVSLTRDTDPSTSTVPGPGGTGSATKVYVAPGINLDKLIKITRDVPGGGGEGLTPGFWKTHSEYGPAPLKGWPDTGYDPDDSYEAVFGVDLNNDGDTLDGPTLLQALGTGGGGLNALLRHSTAALLNAAHPNIAYDHTVADVISLTQAAINSGDPIQIEDLKDHFDALNNQGADLTSGGSGGGGTIMIGPDDADDPPGLEAMIGDTITYLFYVTNTGDAPLEVSLLDDNATPGNPDDDFAPAPVLDGGFNVGDLNDNGLLDPDNPATSDVDEAEKWEYVHTITVATAGEFCNTATVTGTVPQTSITVTASDPACFFVMGDDDEDDDGVADGEGLTPGFWKTHSEYGPAPLKGWPETVKSPGVSYDPDDSYNTIFGVNVAANPTLLEALSTEGGGLNALLRHSTAALLNAAHPEIDYGYTVAEVIAKTKAAIDSGSASQIETLKDEFDALNNQGADLSATSSSTMVITSTSLQGAVWQDDNNDGRVDIGERAIQGAIVRLSGVDELGVPVDRVATTDADGVYVFADLRASNASGYSLAIEQAEGFDDGAKGVGAVRGAAVGSATTEAISEIVLKAGDKGQNYNFAKTAVTLTSGQFVTAGQTATIAFWNNKNGQNLIKSLNGGPQSKQLGNWLAGEFPNMYGADSANNTAGKTNQQVAKLFSDVFKANKGKLKGPLAAQMAGAEQLDPQALAVALALYVTNEGLAGTTAQNYGFITSSTGVGSALFDVDETLGEGTAKTLFGSSTPSVLTVMDILKLTNARSAKGIIFDDGDGVINTLEQALRALACDLFTAINEAGAID